MSGLQRVVIRMFDAFLEHGLSSHYMTATVLVLVLFLQQSVLSAVLSQSVGASTPVKLLDFSMRVSSLARGAVRNSVPLLN